jgi:hypothetical protein
MESPVASLAAKLKSGQITKQELFDQLQEITRMKNEAHYSHSIPMDVDTSTLQDDGPVTTDDFAMDTGDRQVLSSPERQKIIKRLVEEKKRGTNDNATGQFDQSQGTASFIRHERAAEGMGAYSYGSTGGGGETSKAHHGNMPIPVSNAPSTGYSWNRPTTIPQAFTFETDRRIPTSRSERLAEELEEKEREIYTFQPTLPGSHSPSSRQVRQRGENFYERMLKWKDHKHAEAVRSREERLHAELKDCTFAPQVNHATNGSVGGQGELHTQQGDKLPVAERLYREAEARRKDAEKRKEEANSRPEIETSECTFRPKTNELSQKIAKEIHRPSLIERTFATPKAASSSSSTAYTQHRPSSAPSSPRGNGGTGGAMPAGMPPAHANFSFTPRVNAVPPSMPSARRYLEQPTWERLHKSKSARPAEGSGTPEDGGGGYLNTSYASSSMNNGGPSFVTNSSQPTDSTKQPQQQAMAGDHLNGTVGTKTQPRPASASSARKKINIDAFLRRQDTNEALKQERLARVREQTTPSYTPQICRKSVQLAEKTRTLPPGTRPRSASMKEGDYDQECTFRPVINRNARTRKARGPEAMSVGDAMKKEALQQAIKMQVEKESLEGVTFKPTISKPAQKLQGRVTVTSDPDAFMKRLQAEKERKLQREEQLRLEKEKKELQECSFQPEVHEAPAYVKRIARTMRIVRGPRQLPEAYKGWR